MTTYYIAEMTGVFGAPLTLDVAQRAVEELGMPLEAIGCRHMTADDGATGWGAFLLHRTTTSKAKAETAARWLARELGRTDCVFIFTDWQGPVDGAGGAA